MIGILKIFGHLLLGLLFSTAATASDEGRCDLLYAKEISFTDRNASDNAFLTLTGENCASARVQFSIFAENFGTIFSHDVALSSLTPVADLEITKADAMEELERFWSLLGPHPAENLQPWKDPQEIYDLFDEIPALSQIEYEAVRKSNRSYICVQSYYEGADCYWFNSKNQTQLLLNLSD